MRTVRFLMLPAALMVTATTAQAGVPGNYYVSASAGYNAAEDQDLTRNTQNFKAKLGDNVAFTGAVGYKYHEKERGRFRTEFELGYRQNDVDSSSLNGVTQTTSGDEKVYSGMVNGYYDFSRMHKKIVPYIGAGVGVAHVKVNDVRMGTTTADDDSTNFAWQVMAGVDYKVTPKTAVYVDGRYFSVVDPKFSATGGTGDLDGEYDAFTVSAGVKYDF